MSNVIWQKAASPYCHPSRQRMHLSARALVNSAQCIDAL